MPVFRPNGPLSSACHHEPLPLRLSRRQEPLSRNSQHTNTRTSALRRSRKGELLLDLGNGLGRIEPLRTDPGAVHDGVAPIDAHRVIQLRFALLLLLVARVGQPPECLQKNGRTQVLFRVPPVRRAGRRAARAEDALVETIQLLAVVFALTVLPALNTVSGGFVSLERLRDLRLVTG